MNNTYFVSINPEGRVILDSKLHGAPIQEIEAKDYEAARKMVDTSNMYEFDGHGFFVK